MYEIFAPLFHCCSICCCYSFWCYCYYYHIAINIIIFNKCTIDLFLTIAGAGGEPKGQAQKLGIKTKKMYRWGNMNFSNIDPL